MRKYVVIALCLTGYSLMAQTAGSTTVQSAPPANPNQAEITFVKSEHDFGTVKRGQPMTHKFEYKNTGKEDLIIQKCNAGCECTKAKCSLEPLKPGKTAFIEVHYDSTRIGKFGKEVMIHSNARKPVVFLVIRGNVEDPNVAVKVEEPVKVPVEKKTE